LQRRKEDSSREEITFDVGVVLIVAAVYISDRTEDGSQEDHKSSIEFE